MNKMTDDDNVVVLKDMTEVVVEWCLDEELREMAQDYEYEQWLTHISEQQEKEMMA